VKIFWVDFDQIHAGLNFDERASDGWDDIGWNIFSGNREKKSNIRSLGACSSRFGKAHQENMRHSTPRTTGAPDRRSGRGNPAVNVPLKENGGKPEAHSAADPLTIPYDRKLKI
jgi:hypothetical protein